MSKGFAGSKADILRYLREQKASGKIRGFSDPDTEKPKKNAQKKGKTIPKVNKTKAWIAKNLWAWCKANKFTLRKEHMFHGERKWRFDWALPDLKVGIEYEGIVSDKSRHTSTLGYTNDTEKYNEAQKLGYIVIRVTALNYKTLIKHLDEIASVKKQNS